jgi:hypothetical protein
MSASGLTRGAVIGGSEAGGEPGEPGSDGGGGTIIGSIWACADGLNAAMELNKKQSFHGDPQSFSS